ncbi:hypothetical protein [Roseivivax sp. CAU 1753]
MITRVFNAGLRALLMALLVTMPALILPAHNQDVSQMMMFGAILAGLLTFTEYVSTAPSFIEFRSAPPFNRMRFAALFVTLLLVSLCVRDTVMPGAVTGRVAALGADIGRTMDFPFSPVRLVVLLAQDGGSEAQRSLYGALAGLAFAAGLVAVLIFAPLMRFMRWPIRKGAFNVWINLPLFDPTAGGDVIYRLKRDANVNVALGFLLPFLMPALLKFASSAGATLPLGDPQTLIWTVTAWAFLPTSLVMRGMALWRVCDLIEEKRRRAYAQSDMLQAA